MRACAQLHVWRIAEALPPVCVQLQQALDDQHTDGCWRVDDESS
jgi:hypothetical protein